MLVLRRKVGEAIVVDETITVYVLGIEGERIKVGVTAPSDKPIVRGELLTPKVELPQSAPVPPPDQKAHQRPLRVRSSQQEARP